jgi:putative hydrolase of the HAD superfamily
VKVLLLDLYDTIAYADWNAYAAALAGRLGVSVPRLLEAYEETRHARTVGTLGSLAADLGAMATGCGLTLDPGELAALADDMVQERAGRTRLYDDTLPVLRRLRAAGTRLAVISNCDSFTRPVVDRLGLEREVDLVVLSFEVGSSKPQAAIFETTLARLGGPAAADCLFVDDQPSYLDGAAALGIRTCRILRDRPVRPEDHLGRHRVITALTALA